MKLKPVTGDEMIAAYTEAMQHHPFNRHGRRNSLARFLRSRGTTAPENLQPGERVAFHRGVYEKQADGSLRKVRA